MSSQPEQIEPSDIERFTSLWLENQAAAAIFVRMSIHNRHDAEDLLQDVAKEAARSFSNYDPAKPFIAWLIGIARHLMYDYYRKNSRASTHLLSEEIMDTLVAAHILAADQVDERITALRHCMDRLTDRQRDLLKMRYEVGLNPESISKRTGASVTSINQLFYRIRKALANCIHQRLEAV